MQKDAGTESEVVGHGWAGESLTQVQQIAGLEGSLFVAFTAVHPLGWGSWRIQNHVCVHPFRPDQQSVSNYHSWLMKSL